MKVTLDTAATRRHIAGRVRHAIKLSRLSQKEVAARMEISEQYLSDIVNGKRSVSAFVAVRLEHVLGLTAISAHKLLVDQTLEELAAARQELGAKA